MKIKLWDRLALFFGALLTLLSGAALIVAGLQIAGGIGEILPLWARAACIAVGALDVVFAVYLLAFPRKFRAGRHGFVVQRTDNGELRISVKAIESLVQECIDTHKEIKMLSMRIHNTRDGVIVDLSIALANNISIPLAVAQLQKQIKQYLSVSSGIDVKEVRVSVETAQMNVVRPEPLPRQEEEAPAEEESKEPVKEIPAEENKAKVPLHQRIFGRPENPAIVPEPPKEEPAAQEPAPAEEAEEGAEAEAPAQDAEEKPLTEEEASSPVSEGDAPVQEDQEEERHE